MLDKLDLCFCIDLTGSMRGLIKAARQQSGRVLEALRAALGAGLRVGFVGYRDYADGPLLLEVEPLTGELDRVRARIDGVKVCGGGGDGPEAVFAGLTTCLELAWAPGSYRVVFLIGDAPPHSVGARRDAFRKLDPTGLSLDDLANRLETEGLFVHALSLAPHDPVVEQAFRRLSVSTGGTFSDTSSPDAALRVVETLSHQFLADIDFDRALLARLEQGLPTPEELLARALDVPVQKVWGGLMRLRRRGLPALA
jgi:hypothetical protein